MKSTQDSSPQGKPEDGWEAEVEIEMEGDSYPEQLLKAAIKAYEEGFNKFNEKQEIKFVLTITTHKVPTPEGNKDVAYLRLDKHVRAKGVDEDWAPQLFHQEYYVFRNLQERLNPNAPWKESLYINCMARLIAAGLEYGEFLRRTRMIQDAERKTEEERLAKMDLVKANSMPAPLSEDDVKYKEWLANERAKEGL